MWTPLRWIIVLVYTRQIPKISLFPSICWKMVLFLLFTSEPANQRIQKSLFTCWAYTNLYFYSTIHTINQECLTKLLVRWLGGCKFSVLRADHIRICGLNFFSFLHVWNYGLLIKMICFVGLNQDSVMWNPRSMSPALFMCLVIR